MHPAGNTKTRQRDWWLISAAVLTLAGSAAVFAQAASGSPLFQLGIANQWTWTYDYSPYADRALICAFVAGLLGATCWAALRHTTELHGKLRLIFLAGVTAWTFWLQASFPNLGRSSYAQAVYWTATGKINPALDEALAAPGAQAIIRNAQDPQRPFRIHLSTHPPGPVLLYYVQVKFWKSFPLLAGVIADGIELLLPYAGEGRDIVERLVRHGSLSAPERATIYGSMVMLWALVAVGAMPLYCWASDVFGRRAATCAVGFYALTPSLLLFNPMTDQLYVSAALGLLAVWHFGVVSRRPVLLILAGVLSWFALQFTLAFLVLLFACAVQVALQCRSMRPPTMVKLVGWVATGFLLVHLLAMAAGYDAFTVWRLCLANNARFNLGRTYGVWLAYNPFDFALFLGLPVTVCLVRVLVRQLGRRELDLPGSYIWAFAATVVILNLSGTNRGEVARLWMFLMPVFSAIAAATFAPAENQTARAFLGCYALLFIQAVAFKLSLDVMLPAITAG